MGWTQAPCRVIAIAVSFWILVGCAGQVSPAAPTEGDGSQARPVSTAPKTVTIAMNREPTGFGPHQSTDTNLTPLFLATLIKMRVWDSDFQPLVATELPSIEKGTWKVFPDGRMESTWPLRRDVRWHDGSPFTAHDFVFGWQVVLDPQFATLEVDVPSRMESVVARDDHTLVITWKDLFPQANLLVRSGMTALPKALLEADYRRDPTTFAANAYFTSAYVGNGPYRVAGFDPGIGIRFEAFSEYFLGRPKIDTIVYKVISDQNTALAQILANEIDITMRSAIGINPSLTAKERWEANGEGVIHHVATGWQGVGPSWRNPFFDDIRVRRGMLHGLEREEVVRSIFFGLTRVPDTNIRPTDPLFPEVDRRVTKYAYDPNRARQLLSEAGWTVGGDGILVNSRGERFSIEARATSGDRETEGVQAAALDYWRTLGIESQVNNLPRRTMDEKEVRGSWPGVCFCGAVGGSLEPNDPLYRDLHSRFIPTAENGWVGDNQEGWRGGDPFLEQWARELDTPKREQARLQVALKYAEDLPALPLFFSVEVTTVRKGILNAPPRLGSGGANSMTWNVEQWDKE